LNGFFLRSPSGTSFAETSKHALLVFTKGRVESSWE